MNWTLQFSKRNVVFVVSFVVLLVFLGSTFVEGKGQKAKKVSRSFDLGFSPTPRFPINGPNLTAAYDLIQQNAQFVLHHMKIDWKEFENGISEETTSEFQNLKIHQFLADQRKLKFYIVIDPLTHDRVKLHDKLPSNFKKTFADAKLRRSFTNFTLRVARDVKPTYLALGSEMNTYFREHPEDLKNYLSLVEEVYTEVKKVSPKTKITMTFQYESLTGTIGKPAQWDLLKSFSKVLDVVSISTYPSPFFKSPDKIPPHYYRKLTKYTQKPIVIAESGWPTQGSAQFHGSVENQKEFLQQFVKLTRRMEIELWIWWFLHDWQGEGFAEYFRSMGFLTSDGKEKASWSTWKEIHAQPKAK